MQNSTAVVIGPLFLDVIFSSLDTLPAPGQELWCEACELAAGGAANQARGLARLGFDVQLCSYVGEDAAGRLVRGFLNDDDVSPHLLHPIPRQSVTAAISMRSDRAMISSGTNEAPPLSGPAPDVLMGDLRALEANRQIVATWREKGTCVIGDVGWDDNGDWDIGDLAPLDLVDVFVPNEDEACHYMRTETAEEAAAALARHVPQVVVTRGADGCVGANSHAVTSIPACPAEAIDATGAGDVFSAALAWALMEGADLPEAMRAASVAGALSTEKAGGTGAPTLEELRAAGVTVGF